MVKNMADKWDEVTNEDIEEAIKKYDENPEKYAKNKAKSTFLLYNDTEYPAKAIRRISYEVHFNEKPDESKYSGGIGTKKFFEKRNFKIRYTKEEGTSKLGDESFFDYLNNNDKFFTKETIENYLLSLKVKPFVILTGNSGTGKTKLSQLFAEYLEKSNFHMVDVRANARSWGYSEKKGVLGNICGWTLSVDDFRKVLPIDKIEGIYEIEIGGIKTEAYISFLPQLYYNNGCKEFREHFKELYYQEQEQIKRGDKDYSPQKVKVGISYAALNSAIKDEYETRNEISIDMKIANYSKLRLPQEIMEYTPIKSTIPCEIRSEDYFAKGNLIFTFRISNFKTEDIENYFEELKNRGIDRFELKIFGFTFDVKNNNGINAENYIIVPVGANWTENRNVVGYYNVLTKSYQHTPSLDLLMEATGKDIPYFLILDEMNLSHVERYFSDFLSAMESHKPIPLHKHNDENNENPVPQEIEIPENLFIIGTVNVDETTYMFSPKVLDRANVLEFKTFEDISINDYVKRNNPKVEFKGDITYLEDPLSDLDLRNNILTEINKGFDKVQYEENIETFENEDQEEYGTSSVTKNNLLDKITTELTTFNDYLKGSGFEFGYRTVNEILTFMFVAWKYEGEQKIWNNWRRYFDAQILQKILPKLHGSQMELADTLDNLLTYCLDMDELDGIPNMSEINGNYPYPCSAKKLMEMRNVLDKRMYVSFIN